MKGNDFALISMGGFCDLEVDSFRKSLLQTTTPYSLIIHLNPEETYFQAKKFQRLLKHVKKLIKSILLVNA